MSAKPLPYTSGIKRMAAEPVATASAYLVDNLGCFHCHSKKPYLGKLYQPWLQSPGYLAGGAKLKGAQGIKIYASNITPDKNTGIEQLYPTTISQSNKTRRSARQETASADAQIEQAKRHGEWMPFMLICKRYRRWRHKVEK